MLHDSSFSSCGSFSFHLHRALNKIGKHNLERKSPMPCKTVASERVTEETAQARGPAHVSRVQALPLAATWPWWPSML